jgi:Protein of unknown function (DUF502)
VTWLAVEFVFRKPLAIGAPVVGALRRTLSGLVPGIASHVSWPAVDKIIAITSTIFIFYIVGWAAHRVFGRRLIAWFEDLLGRVPLTKTIYGGVRKLISTFEGQSTQAQRVVLINFPSEEMKTVGILTRTVTEEATGRALAIVIGRIELSHPAATPTSRTPTVAPSVSLKVPSIRNGAPTAPPRKIPRPKIDSGEAVLGLSA